MESFDPNDMPNYDSEYNYNSDVSHNPDASRPPQLNGRIPGHGGTNGRQNIGEGEDADGDTDAIMNGVNPAPFCKGCTNDGNASDDGSVEGQEGLEDASIRVPGHEDYIRIKSIFIALARHDDCTCHRHRRLGDEHPQFIPGTPMLPGMYSPSSVVAEHGGNSAEQSMENSVVWSSRSQTPSDFDRFIGSLFIDEPLMLTPDIFHYPLDISIHEDDDNENEMKQLTF